MEISAMQINIKKQSELNTFSLDILCNRYVSVGSDWNCENVINAFSRLYYIESGCGKLYFDDEEIMLTPGNVYFIPTGTRFSYHCTDENFMCKLFFHLSLISPKDQYDLFSNIKKGIYSLSFQEANACNIFDIYRNDDYTSLLGLKTILYNTLVAFYAKYNWGNTEIKKYPLQVLNIMEYIQSHLSIGLTIKEISDTLFLSESSVSKSFKAETGITIGTYIDNLIFTKANQLLLDKNNSLRDISTSLGFCDQFYFSRRFKEKFGMSPQQYRRSQLQF